MANYKNDERRSAIWSVGAEYVSLYLAIYVILYLLGTGGILWLHLQDASVPVNTVSDIITSMSLLGVGIAPPAAIVLTELWRYTVVLARRLEQRWAEKDAKALQAAREQALKERLEQALKEGLKEGYECGVEAGRARAEGRDPGPPPWENEPDERE